MKTPESKRYQILALVVLTLSLLTATSSQTFSLTNFIKSQANKPTITISLPNPVEKPKPREDVPADLPCQGKFSCGEVLSFRDAE